MGRLLLLVLLLLAPAWGQDLAAQEKRVQDLEAQAARARALEEEAAKRIQALNRELAQISQRLKNLLGEKAALEKEIARLEAERRRLKQETARLKEEVRQTEARIAKLEKDLEALRERLQALMVSLHRERAGRYLPLLRAESFTDLAVRARWVGYISRQDTALVKTLQATLKALREEKARLELLVQSLTAKEAELAETQQALEAKRRGLEAVLAELRREEAGKKALLRDALEERAQLQSRLAELQKRLLEERQRLKALQEEAERRRREEEARRAAPASVVVPPPPLPATVGRLAFPVPGGRIAVPYGKEGPFQVIAAPAPGSPVQAAADGYVAGVLYLPNLGYTVMLVHTEELATVYTNLQAPLVQEGDRVRQGQVIGYLGGGLLIQPNELEFRVALRTGDATRFVDPSAYY